jgi:D-amino-acid dehydrogenase
VKVVVVGAGVAGLCCAYYLRRRDADVVVLDAEPVGSRVASSYGNGGWICPAQAGPLPEPGLTAYGLRALLARDSALYFRPGLLRMIVVLV